MKGTFYTLLIFILKFSGYLFSQQPTQEWVARYQSTTEISGIANKMTLDKVGNCYVLGEFLDINNDVVLIKYNLAGDTLWTRTFQSSGNDLPYGVIADSIGNSYITLSSGLNFGPYDIVTIKYNPQGVQQWLKIYNSGGNDEPRDITMDKNGFIYIAGFTSNESLIIKYNPNNGDTIWTRKYTETDYRFAGISIALDNRNNIIIGGNRFHTMFNVQVFFTIKYDSAGVFKWIVPNPLGGILSLRKVAIDNNYNVIVTGRSYAIEFLTIKYDSAGTEVWQSIYNGLGGEIVNDMRLDRQDNVIITGASFGSGSGSDYVTIKYNNVNGDSLWVRRYNGTGNDDDVPYSLDIDDSNNAYVTSRSIGNFNNWDYTTIKFNNSGNQQWIVRYPNLPNNGGIAYGIALDKFRNIYVTGLSDSSGVGRYVTIKYSQPVGIINISNNIPNKFYLYQSYPNPFNPVTKIKFGLPQNANVKLTVYDVLGREIAILVNEFKHANTYEVDFDGTALPSGVYFYNLDAGEFTAVRKMLLVK
jgi:hypothetical protein